MMKYEKIAIVAANNLRVSPYVNYYVKIFKSLGVEIFVFTPNRIRIKEEIADATVKQFNKWDNSKSNIINYFRYSRWVKNEIRNTEIKVAIGCAALNSVCLSDLLLNRKYIKRYLIDIRDYSYEKYMLFRTFEKKLFNHSYLNVISSPKYTDFLPDSNYHVCHNISFDDNEKCSFRRKTNEKIVIGYVGAISYRKQCEKLIDLVENDSRFEFHFFGDGMDGKHIKNYIEIKDNSRIVFHGPYYPSEKPGIIKSVDLLFNAYGNDSPRLCCALSNKLYDALHYKKPIINSPNTYMNKVAGPYSFAIDLDECKSLQDLYVWYNNLNSTLLDEYAENLMSQFERENEITSDKIKAILYD